MATAMAFPDPAKLKRKGMFPEETSDAGFNKATLSKARYVLRNNPIPEGEDYPQRCLHHHEKSPIGEITMGLSYYGVIACSIASNTVEFVLLKIRDGRKTQSSYAPAEFKPGANDRC